MNGSFKPANLRLCLIAVAMLLVLACSLVAGTPAPATDTPPAGQMQATPTRTAFPPSSGDTATDVPPTPQVDACPQGPATFSLMANHHFWTSTGMGDWVWQANGSVLVSLDGAGVVTNTGPQSFPGTQSGTFSSESNTCSFEAPAEVILTLEGSCSQSVLSLEIWEDWQMGTYDWNCDDDSFQFDLPAQMMPPSIHKVSYDLSSGGPYAAEVPFGGGSGNKVYTLVP